MVPPQSAAGHPTCGGTVTKWQPPSPPSGLCAGICIVLLRACRVFLKRLLGTCGFGGHVQVMPLSGGQCKGGEGGYSKRRGGDTWPALPRGWIDSGALLYPQSPPAVGCRVCYARIVALERHQINKRPSATMPGTFHCGRRHGLPGGLPILVRRNTGSGCWGRATLTAAVCPASWVHAQVTCRGAPAQHTQAHACPAFQGQTLHDTNMPHGARGIHQRRPIRRADLWLCPADGPSVCIARPIATSFGGGGRQETCRLDKVGRMGEGTVVRGQGAWTLDKGVACTRAWERQMSAEGWPAAPQSPAGWGSPGRDGV